MKISNSLDLDIDRSVGAELRIVNNVGINSDIDS